VTEVRTVAIDLDALGDTRALWSDWLESARAVLGIDPTVLSNDRGAAAAELDRHGAGNWRALLERYSEDRAPIYLRRDAETSAALRALASSGRALGVFTDAPEPLARIALAQAGAEHRVSALETGAGALDRLLARIGADAVVIHSRAELVDLTRDAK
jgi:phosphoglycolate phosphatase-like HAD superfamily hydrolase